MRYWLTALLAWGVATLHAQVFDITNFGAVGNGSTLNTAFIQAAIDSCHNSGGGVVRVPPGNFLTATLYLKSNVNFLIDSGATVTGSSDIAQYPVITPAEQSYADNYTQRSVFYAEGQHNIAVTGKGTFNGNGLSPSFFLDSDNKPYGFRFISCSNVRYEGLTLRNSGFWMMHNFNIDTLVIKKLNIVNQNLGNGDGVNIDGCRHVMVDSIVADCNDDPLVIKSTSLHLTEDVEIGHCTVMTYSRAIKIGTETHGPVRNVYIHDIEVKLSNTAPIEAKCGINLSVVDGGSMENVLIENVTMSGIKVPLFIRLGNRGRKYTPSAPQPGVGTLRDIELRNITATASTNVTGCITGIPGYRSSYIRLRNVDITFPGGRPAVRDGFVLPENEAGGPEATMFGDTIPAAGLYMRHVDSILLDNVCFHSLQYDQRPTLVLEDVPHFDSTGVCIISSVNNATGLLQPVLYPNPVGGNSVEITLPDEAGGEVAVYSTSGQLCTVTRFTGSRCRLAVQGLVPGIYVVQVNCPARAYRLKMLKQ